MDPARLPLKQGAAATRPTASGPGRVALGITRVALIVAIACAGLWGTIALWFASPGPRGMQLVLAGAFGAIALAALASALASSGRRYAVTCYAAAFEFLLAWWNSIEPSNDRDWQPDVARLPYAEIRGGSLPLAPRTSGCIRA